MICAVVIGPSFFEAREQIHKCFLSADFIELRLDNFIFNSIDKLVELKELSSLPLIIKIGGSFPIEEILEKVNPQFVDVEFNEKNFAILNFLKNFSPKQNVIVSFHDFEKIPHNLHFIIKNMITFKNYRYKVACMASSFCNVCRLFDIKKKFANVDIDVIPLGEYGKFSRLIPKTVGNDISYFSIKDTPPQKILGQFSIYSLKLYGTKNVKKKSPIYSLVGFPLSQSIGHILHNKAMRFFDICGVYLKIPLKSSEIEEFIKFALENNIAGSSITVPLKENWTNYLSSMTPRAKAIGAINTLKVNKGKLIGDNTDCVGFISAIEEVTAIKGKNVFVVGGGGVARAIAYSAKICGGEVFIFNRTLSKAMDIANVFGCHGFPISDVEKYAEKCDIFVKATLHTVDIKCPVKNKIVMDVSPKSSTSFLRNALRNNNEIISGLSMFLHQAIEQFHFWHNYIDKAAIKDYMTAIVKDIEKSSK